MPTPGVLEYPAALDTALSLIQVNNNALSTLTAGISVSDLLIPVADPSKFPNSGFAALVDSLTAPTKIEIIVYTSKSGSDLVVPPGGRGVQGTTAFAFSTGNFVDMRPTARHHTVLADLLLAIEAKLGIGAFTPGGGAQALISDTSGASIWRALTAADVANVVRKDDAALQAIISNLTLGKDSPALTLQDTVGGVGADFFINRNGNATNIGRAGQSDLILDNNTGIYTFGQIPILPGSDPASANQAARKGYVDGKKVSFAASFTIVDPSTANLNSRDFGSLVIPGGGQYTITKCKVMFREGSHASGGSLTFKVDRAFVGDIATLTLNNTNNAVATIYPGDIGDINVSENEIFSVYISARSGTITEKDVSVIVEGYRTLF